MKRWLLILIVLGIPLELKAQCNNTNLGSGITCIITASGPGGSNVSVTPPFVSSGNLEVIMGAGIWRENFVPCTLGDSRNPVTNVRTTSYTGLYNRYVTMAVIFNPAVGANHTVSCTDPGPASYAAVHVAFYQTPANFVLNTFAAASLATPASSVNLPTIPPSASPTLFVAGCAGPPGSESMSGGFSAVGGGFHHLVQAQAAPLASTCGTAGMDDGYGLGSLILALGPSQCDNTSLGDGITCVMTVSAEAPFNTGTAITPNFTSSGNLEIIAVQNYVPIGGDTNPCLMADSLNPNPVAIPQASGGPGTARTRFWYVINPVTGPNHNVRCTMQGGSDQSPRVMVTFYNNTAGWQFGSQVQNSIGRSGNNGATINLLTPSITPSQVPALIVGSCASYGGVPPTMTNFASTFNAGTYEDPNFATGGVFGHIVETTSAGFATTCTQTNEYALGMAVQLATFAPLAPPPAMSVVNNGNAFGFATSMTVPPDAVTLTTQTNGQPFNTTDADLIIVNVASDQLQVGIQDFLNGSLTANQWTQLFPTSVVGSGGNIFYTRPTQTGANASFRVNGVGTACYCSITVLAVKGWDGMAPTQSGRAINGTFIGGSFLLPQPLTNTVPNDDLLVSTIGVYCPQNLMPYPAALQQFVGSILPCSQGMGYAIITGWKFGTTASENPIWTVGSFGSPMQTNLHAAIFHAGNAVPPPPAIEFAVQPSLTAPGNIITPWVEIRHSNPNFNGTVTLTRGPTTGACSLVSLANATATFINGLAVFPNLQPQAAAANTANCFLTANASDGTSVQSTNYNITRRLIITQEPSNVVNGGVMSPPLALTTNDANTTSPNIAIAQSSAVGCAAGSLVLTGNTGTMMNAQIAFTNLTVTTSDGMPRTGCRFQISGSNPAYQSTLTDLFDVTVPPPSIQFVEQPGFVVAGVPVAPPWKSVVEIQHSNPNFNGTVTLSIVVRNDCLAVSIGGGATATFVNGHATFPNLTFTGGQARTACSILATSSDNATVVSQDFPFRLGGIVFTTQPQNSVVGQVMAPVVMTVFGNPGGTFIILPNPLACGVTLTGTSSQTMPNGGTAGATLTWTNLTPNQPGTNCTMGSTRADLGAPMSAPFNVTNVPPPSGHPIVVGGGIL